MIIESGHNGFDVEAEETGFDYLLEEKKKILLNSGYQGDITQEAMHLSMPIFEKRHKLNKNFWESELQRETETVTMYEIRYNKERDQLEMYHPGYETFLQDMLLRTERYAKEKNQPHVFNREEMNAIIQAEHALVSGDAKTILYPVWHESGNVRYVTEMIVEGGLVKNRYVDVGKIAGKDLSQQEALSLFQTIRGHHEWSEEKQDQKNIAYPMLYLRKDEVGFREIASTTYERFHEKNTEIPRQHIHNQEALPEQTGYETRLVLQDTRGESQEYLGTLQNAERLYQDKFVPYIQHRVEVKSENKKEQRKGTRPLMPVEHNRAYISKMRKSLLFVHKTGIGMNGIVGTVDSSAVVINESNKKEQKTYRRKNKKERAHGSFLEGRRTIDRKKKSQRKLNGEFFAQGIKRKERTLFVPTDQEIFVNKKKEKRGKKDKRKRTGKTQSIVSLFEQKNLIRTVHTSMQERHNKIGVKEKVKKEKTKNNFQRKKEMRLYLFFEKMSRNIRKEKSRIKQYSEKIRASHKREKSFNNIFSKDNIGLDVFDFLFKSQEKSDKRIIDLSFVQSWVLFVLISHPVLEQMPFAGKIAYKEQSKKNDLNADNKPSVWVLLSIIWYMTMIREQGMTQMKIKKKKKKKLNTLLQYGVIYAYQS